MPNSQEATRQTTNETQTTVDTQSVTETQQLQQSDSQPTENAVPETKPVEVKPVEVKPVEPTRKSHSDRITELESKIAKMEAIYQLQGQNVVDMEVCTDLLLKGYTIEQLKQSKPYLFGQQSASAQGVIRQPPKVVSETQTPKTQISNVSSDGFVKTLANMLMSKF